MQTRRNKRQKQDYASVPKLPPIVLIMAEVMQETLSGRQQLKPIKTMRRVARCHVAARNVRGRNTGHYHVCGGRFSSKDESLAGLGAAVCKSPCANCPEKRYPMHDGGGENPQPYQGVRESIRPAVAIAVLQSFVLADIRAFGGIVCHKG